MSTSASFEVAASGARHRSTSLSKLAVALGRARHEFPLTRLSGRVVDISESTFRVAGLSNFVRLGDHVCIELNGQLEVGEVLRIGREHATVKLFATRGDVGLGMRVFKHQRPSVAPAAGWKGRTIDALARVIDGGEPLEPGRKTTSLDA